MTEVIVEASVRAFFSPKSLAAYLELSERTVRQLLADGKIPSYRFEGSRRVSAEDVERYVEASKEPPRTSPSVPSRPARPGTRAAAPRTFGARIKTRGT